MRACSCPGLLVQTLARVMPFLGLTNYGIRLRLCSSKSLLSGPSPANSGRRSNYVYSSMECCLTREVVPLDSHYAFKSLICISRRRICVPLYYLHVCMPSITISMVRQIRPAFKNPRRQWIKQCLPPTTVGCFCLKCRSLARSAVIS
ncbi:hypothetical protein DFH06DRAFT_50881 [Mycena polygramma]|nr:hypothetical protein DFH06DRAFT_50881 [Mycena polygramma]